MTIKTWLQILTASVLLLVAGVAVDGYYTQRLWRWQKKVPVWMEYYTAAIDCLIQENGQSENDVDILFKGYKSRKAWIDAENKATPGLYDKDESSRIIRRDPYDDQLPECHKFYSQYQCWELDATDPASLDKCGHHFHLNDSDIDAIKKAKDKKERDRLLDVAWDRWEKEKKQRGEK